MLLLQILGERGKVYRLSNYGFQWCWETQTRANRKLIHGSLLMNHVLCSKI